MGWDLNLKTSKKRWLSEVSTRRGVLCPCPTDTSVMRLPWDQVGHLSYPLPSPRNAATAPQPVVIHSGSSRILFLCEMQTFRSKGVCNPFAPISVFLMALCTASLENTSAHLLRCVHLNSQGLFWWGDLCLCVTTPATEVSLPSRLQNAD